MKNIITTTAISIYFLLAGNLSFANNIDSIDSRGEKAQKVSIHQFGEIVKNKMNNWLTEIELERLDGDLIPIEFEVNEFGKIIDVKVNSNDGYVNFQVKRKLLGKELLQDNQTARFVDRRFSTQLRFRSA